MHINIYSSVKFPQKREFERFFIDNFMFKNKNNYMAGELVDLFFYDIKDYKIDNGFDIILIDEYLINEVMDNDEINSKFFQKWDSSDNKNIIFITLSKNYYLIKISGKVNFIELHNKKDGEKFEFLFTEIAHDILRFLLKKEKLNIFISYARRDGENTAKAIKSFIDSNLKLSNFFDRVDIMDSERWDKKLKNSIKKSSLFLYVMSDTYAQTLWTKKEFIFAKENLKPIIGVDVLSEMTEVFPLTANTKLFKILQTVQKIEVNCQDNYMLHTENNLRAIINFLLKEALEFELGKQKGVNLPRKPDYFDVCNIQGDIIYPDPPMMNVELEVLKKCFNGRNINTPFTKNIKSVNKKIAISISEPPNLEDKGMRIEHLNLLMIEIARYLIISGATLIYGGNLGYKKEFNFTSILAETFRAYNKLYENENQKLINFSVYPFCEKIDLELKHSNADAIKFEDCIGDKCDFKDIDKIAQNLTKMREKITKDMDIKIAVGGKISGFSGFYPGVLEEVYLALKAEKPVILIKGFGGIVDKIADFIEGKEVEELSFEYQTRVNVKLDKFLRDNGLSDEVKSRYEEMLKVISQKRDIVKIIEFEGFEILIRSLIREF